MHASAMVDLPNLAESVEQSRQASQITSRWPKKNSAAPLAIYSINTRAGTRLGNFQFYIVYAVYVLQPLVVQVDIQLTNNRHPTEDDIVLTSFGYATYLTICQICCCQG